MSDFEYEDDDYGYDEDQGGAGVTDLYTEAEFAGLGSAAAFGLLCKVLETATESDVATLKKTLMALLCHPATTVDRAVYLLNRLHQVSYDMDTGSFTKGISQLVRLGASLSLLKAQPWYQGDSMRLALMIWAEHNLEQREVPEASASPTLASDLKECEDKLYDWILNVVNKPSCATATNMAGSSTTPVCAALYIILQIHRMTVKAATKDAVHEDYDSFPADPRCARILDYLQRASDINTTLDVFIKTLVVNLALVDYCILTNAYDPAWDRIVDLLSIANNQVQNTTCHVELYKRVLVLEVLAPRRIDINTLCNLSTHGIITNAVESSPDLRCLTELVSNIHANSDFIRAWNPLQQILLKVRKFVIKRSNELYIHQACEDDECCMEKLCEITGMPWYEVVPLLPAGWCLSSSASGEWCHSHVRRIREVGGYERDALRLLDEAVTTRWAACIRTAELDVEQVSHYLLETPL